MSGKINSREAAKEFLDYTTIHGLGRMKNSPYRFLKVFWFFSFLIAIGMVTFELYRLTVKYYEKPVSTHVEIETVRRMRFPAVTFCNLNPVKFSLMKNNTELLQIIYEAGKEWNVDMSSFGLENYTDADFKHLEPLSNVSDKGVFSGASRLLQLRLGGLSDQEITAMSQSTKDFLIDCTFAGSQCILEYIRTYRSYDYGTCFTFGAKNYSHYNIATPGKNYGLDLVLNVDQSEYIPFVTASAGVAVVVHHPDSPPFEDVDAITVPTGFESNIGVHVEVLNRQPGSTERCVKNSSYDNILQCQKECLEVVIEGECGCYSRLYTGYYYYDYYHRNESHDVIYDDADINDVTQESTDMYENTLPPCSNLIDSKCIEEAKHNFGLGFFTCSECKPPCFQRKYVKSVSSTTWPAKNYQPVLDSIMKKLDRATKKKSHSSASIRENLVHIRVFMSTFNVHSVVEEYSYESEQFVSDIGGQLGLWVGLSVLFLCELVELVFLLITGCRRRKKENDH